MVKVTDMMYSPLENVFENTIKREGKEITVVNSGTTFQGFFRRFDDGQSTEDRITQLEETCKVLSAVTSADAGKYLRVNANGKWEVATVNQLGDIMQN